MIYGSQVWERGNLFSLSHAWLLDISPMHFARRRCAIGPRRIAVFIDVVLDVVICPKWIEHIKTTCVSYKNGCSPRPNCTPTACVVWGCCIRTPGMRVRGRQAPSHSHTWLPYITPNGVRLAQEALKKLTFPSHAFLYIYNTFFSSMFLYPWNIKKKIMEISFLQKMPNPFSHEKEFGRVFLKTSFYGSGAKTHFK